MVHSENRDAEGGGGGAGVTWATGISPDDDDDEDNGFEEEVERVGQNNSGGNVHPSRMVLDRRMSETALTLTPGFHAQMRKLEPTHAIFNLVSTIMGGGVLSLPYALSKTGIIAGLTLIIMAAAMSDFSVYLLVAAARRTGL